LLISFFSRLVVFLTSYRHGGGLDGFGSIGVTFEFCRLINGGMMRRGGGAATPKTGDKRVTNAAAAGEASNCQYLTAKPRVTQQA